MLPRVAGQGCVKWGPTASQEAYVPYVEPRMLASSSVLRSHACFGKTANVGTAMWTNGCRRSN
eukprot:7953433-Alexandrium_andersonii.AAC.1